MKVRATQQVEVELDVHTKYEVTMNFIRNIFDFLPSQYVYDGKLYRTTYDSRCDDVLIGDATEEDIAKYNILQYIEKEYKNSYYYK